MGEGIEIKRGGRKGRNGGRRIRIIARGEGEGEEWWEKE